MVTWLFWSKKGPKGICPDVLTGNWGKGLEVAEFHFTPDLRDAQGHDVTFHLVQAELAIGMENFAPTCHPFPKGLPAISNIM